MRRNILSLVTVAIVVMAAQQSVQARPFSVSLDNENGIEKVRFKIENSTYTDQEMKWERAALPPAALGMGHVKYKYTRGYSPDHVKYYGGECVVEMEPGTGEHLSIVDFAPENYMLRISFDIWQKWPRDKWIKIGEWSRHKWMQDGKWKKGEWKGVYTKLFIGHYPADMERIIFRLDDRGWTMSWQIQERGVEELTILSEKRGKF
jgi:hypothetical protein